MITLIVDFDEITSPQEIIDSLVDFSFDSMSSIPFAQECVVLFVSLNININAKRD